jgi:hypothetical protein
MWSLKKHHVTAYMGFDNPSNYQFYKASDNIKINKTIILVI